MFASLIKLFSKQQTSESPASNSTGNTHSDQNKHAPEIVAQTIELFCHRLQNPRQSPPPLLCYQKQPEQKAGEALSGSEQQHALQQQWLPALSNALSLNQAFSLLPESQADCYAICWLTELAHKESAELQPVLMIEAATGQDEFSTLYVQSLDQNQQPISKPVATGQMDNALTHFRQLPITPDQLPDQDSNEKLPALFCLPVATIYLALEEFSKSDQADFFSAMQRGQDQLAELSESGSLISQSLCQLAVNAMLNRTQASMLPSLTADFEQLLAQVEVGIRELQSAMQNGNFKQQDCQIFTDELLLLVDAVFDGIKDNQSYKNLLQLQQQVISPQAA
ncbi:hypothetical protein [Pelagibaculum spongiae]|uniref:Uncharacterized protein n=1 Tax=Pelagibaculum spongiae TaxID=2080658 RepID=A0A2V1GVP0_9GAMM|nr:hypothetical protein [Pelagibaculum spongiae]PVZ63881.1 hypothetical protein DC094_20350 [Pelagibaculum spongiae]